MARHEESPEQAAADIERLNDELSRLDSAVDEAVERAEAIEAEMDAAHEAGDEAAVADASHRHQQAEIAIQDARTDFESGRAHLNSTIEFWEY